MDHLIEELARSRRQDLLDEAVRCRLAEAARRGRVSRSPGVRASTFRRDLAEAVIGLGVRLAGRGVDSPASPR